MGGGGGGLLGPAGGCQHGDHLRTRHRPRPSATPPLCSVEAQTRTQVVTANIEVVIRSDIQGPPSTSYLLPRRDRE